MEEIINLGQWSEEEMNSILRRVCGESDTGKKINWISRFFLHVTYRESTLKGSTVDPEMFVINLEAVDCFTFLDYVEALRLAKSFNEFRDRLKKIRYQEGIVQYEKRNHFFINWKEYHSDFVEDITPGIGKSECVDKLLNDRGDGTLYVPGIACIRSTFSYIPSEFIDGIVIETLKTGDYIGIYSDKPGLDVSHVGIFIRDRDKTFIRHASHTYMKVVDEDFKEYIKNKPGIIVLRPNPENIV
ncbi:MAG: DUF1460 domain-containing protein [Nitrospiraceae bacterium]|nr:MAG: DUF1460 domain-containing protein [Nitrospiraceae bacterium]